MAELFLNGSIDHDNVPAQPAWRTSGQLALDMGCAGIRFASHQELRFDAPTDGLEPFFALNVDRAAALGLKMSIIFAPTCLRSAAWDALGGDWDGYIPSSVDWRATRIPNTPAVNAAVLAHVLTNLEYAVDQLGEENVQVEIANEPRHVFRSGGDPNTTLTAPAVSATTLQVASNAGFEDLLDRGGYIIVETTPRQYAQMGDFGDGTIEVATPITADSGTVIRAGDSYLNDGQVEAAYLDQNSQLAAGIRAAFPNVRQWLFAIWMLGDQNTVNGIKTYIDFLDSLNEATYPGFVDVDGFGVNLYPAMPTQRLDSHAYSQRAVDFMLEVIAYARTKTKFGLDTKPFAIQEFGATYSDLRMSSGMPKSEVQRAKCVRQAMDRLAAIGPDVDRVCLYAARSGTDDGELTDYYFLDVNGNVSKGLTELSKARQVSSNTAPSGYTNSGLAYLGSASGVSPF